LTASYTASSSPTLDANHFAPPSLTRSNSTRNNSKLLLQKDKLIEELRLELAELQIKLMEIENKGGGHMQGLEKALMEARVTNARLMEENESFQSLLMEKTLNGDFSQKGVHAARVSEGASSSDGQPLSASLADELASAEDSEQDQEAERVRRLEVEVERQKAENKALTLYINKIIERILKHQGGFETILSNADDEVSTPAPALPNKDKELPPPPVKDGQQEPQSILQRTKSLVYGRNKPRPQSVVGPLTGSPSITENPSTAPSIPLQRSNTQRQSLATPRRAGASGEFGSSGAAALVGNMYRGLDQENVSTVSPGINSPRSSYFNLINRAPSQPGGPRPPTSERPAAASDNRPGTSSADGSAADDAAEDARRAALDALNGGGEPSDAGNRPPSEAPSPPRSLGSNRDDGRQQAVLHGNKVRPLRLVAEEQQKKNANRASWMPNVGQWFNAAGGGPAGPGGGG
jgi:hypothetical protein